MCYASCFCDTYIEDPGGPMEIGFQTMSGKPMAFQIKIKGGAHGIIDKDHGGARGTYMYLHDNL